MSFSARTKTNPFGLLLLYLLDAYCVDGVNVLVIEFLMILTHYGAENARGENYMGRSNNE